MGDLDKSRMSVRACLLVVSASLFTVELAQPPLNNPLPTHAPPVAISGGQDSQSCPVLKESK